jgi:hypothetical protein
MSKQAIFFASTTTGLALFGAVAFMQMNRHAFTNAPQVDLQQYLYSEVPAQVVQEPASPPEPAPGVMMLPPIEVYSRPRAPAATEPVTHEKSVPCSPWREVAPRHVDDGKASGAVSVRDLC